MRTATLEPGNVSLEQWRSVYRGAPVAISPANDERIAASAAAVTRILAKGAAVYGINTGFGKLATTRIDGAELSMLQRNIVLSHAAGVGKTVPKPVARLMLALKLTNLAQGPPA